MLAAFPQSLGSGRAIQHLNRGRIAFLEGNFEEARKTWLGARARYGNNYEFHRRADYFIAQALIYKAWAELKKSAGDFEAFDVRQNFFAGVGKTFVPISAGLFDSGAQMFRDAFEKLDNSLFLTPFEHGQHHSTPGFILSEWSRNLCAL